MFQSRRVLCQEEVNAQAKAKSNALGATEEAIAESKAQDVAESILRVVIINNIRDVERIILQFI